MQIYKIKTFMPLLDSSNKPNENDIDSKSRMITMRMNTAVKKHPNERMHAASDHKSIND